MPKKKKFLPRQLAKAVIRKSASAKGNADSSEAFAAVFYTFMDAPELLSAPGSNKPIKINSRLKDTLEDLQTNVKEYPPGKVRELDSAVENLQEMAAMLYNNLRDYEFVKDSKIPDVINPVKERINIALTNILTAGMTTQMKMIDGGKIKEIVSNADWLPQLMTVYDKFNEIRYKAELAELPKRFDDLGKPTLAEAKEAELKNSPKWDAIDRDLFGLDTAKQVPLVNKTNNAARTPPAATAATTKKIDNTPPPAPITQAAPVRAEDKASTQNILRDKFKTVKSSVTDRFAEALKKQQSEKAAADAAAAAAKEAERAQTAAQSRQTRSQAEPNIPITGTVVRPVKTEPQPQPENTKINVKPRATTPPPPSEPLGKYDVRRTQRSNSAGSSLPPLNINKSSANTLSPASPDSALSSAPIAPAPPPLTDSPPNLAVNQQAAPSVAERIRAFNQNTAVDSATPGSVAPSATVRGENAPSTPEQTAAVAARLAEARKIINSATSTAQDQIKAFNERLKTQTNAEQNATPTKPVIGENAPTTPLQEDLKKVIPAGAAKTKIQEINDRIKAEAAARALRQAQTKPVVDSNSRPLVGDSTRDDTKANDIKANAPTAGSSPQTSPAANTTAQGQADLNNNNVQTSTIIPPEPNPAIISNENNEDLGLGNMFAEPDPGITPASDATNNNLSLNRHNRLAQLHADEDKEENEFTEPDDKPKTEPVKPTIVPEPIVVQIPITPSAPDVTDETVTTSPPVLDGNTTAPIITPTNSTLTSSATLTQTATATANPTSNLLTNWDLNLANDVIRLSQIANDSTALNQINQQTEHFRLKSLEFRHDAFENLTAREQLKTEWLNSIKPLTAEIARNTARLTVAKDNLPNCLNFLAGQNGTRIKSRDANTQLTQCEKNLATYEKMWEQLVSIRDSLDQTSQADYKDRIRFTGTKVVKFAVDATSPETINAEIAKHYQGVCDDLKKDKNPSQVVLKTQRREEQKVDVKNEAVIIALKGNDSNQMNIGSSNLLAKVNLDLDTIYNVAPLNTRGEYALNLYQFREDLSEPHIMAKLIIDGTPKLQDLMKYFPEIRDPSNLEQAKSDLVNLFKQVPPGGGVPYITALLSRPTPQGAPQLNTWFSPSVSTLASALNNAVIKATRDPSNSGVPNQDAMLMAKEWVENMKDTSGGGDALIFQPNTPPLMKLAVSIYCDAKVRETNDPKVKAQYQYFDPQDPKATIHKEHLKKFSINPFTIYAQITESRKVSQGIKSLQDADKMSDPLRYQKEVSYGDQKKIDNMYVKSSRELKLHKALQKIDLSAQQISNPDLQNRVDAQAAAGPPSKRRSS
jgi:hypothetical protein